ncbi:MAG: Rne/Rng family ribonuclease [Clostridia bacterium]|nr:Rne/Rng family ribonuclease [Clostridia bacterium]
MKKEMKKEWFLDQYCGHLFAALLEDGKLTEFSSEKESRIAGVGNIYKGKVTNVLSGMNAAFINCGLEKNCYLSMEESYTDYTKYDGTLGESQTKPLDLKVGDEIIVQVMNPPRGNKGAKVTTHISFVGKMLIYLPTTDFLGISRKITDEGVRSELLKTADNMREKTDEGFIVRTQAPLATQEMLEREAKYLKNLYLEMEELAKNSSVGALLYEDEDLPVRVMRDSYGDELTAIHVGNPELYKRLLHLIKLRQDIPEGKLQLHKGRRAMFQEHGITPLIREATQPTVPLENGGYIVIEHTEAMTVVDVNTGSYVGESNLEETVFAVNLAAAKEIARQVRLRNIGGIIAVDFIDMVDEEHKIAVTETLRDALALDKAKCNVLPMSEFCITQFTRKRLGRDVLSYLVKPCKHCGGMGYINDDISIITQLRTDVLDKFAENYNTVIVELNESIFRRLLQENLFAEELKTIWKDKRVYCVPHKTYEETYYVVRGDNAENPSLPEKAQLLR